MDWLPVLLPPLLLSGNVFISAETVAAFGQEGRLPNWLRQGLMTRQRPRGAGRVMSMIVGAVLTGLGLWAMVEIAVMTQQVAIVQLAVWAQVLSAVLWLLYLARRRHSERAL
jgi:hypothetical protein